MGFLTSEKADLIHIPHPELEQHLCPIHSATGSSCNTGTVRQTPNYTNNGIDRCTMW